MELVPKAKYSHFRSESLNPTDDTNSNSSLPPSGPDGPVTPPGLPSSLSSTSLTPILPPSSPCQPASSPTTLCSFFPGMGTLRLGVQAALLLGPKPGSRSQQQPAPPASKEPPRGASAEPAPPTPPLTAPSPPPRPLQDMNRLGGASRRARVEGGQLGGDEWTRHGSFVNKPTRGWLHSDSVYMGCVEVLQSMRALDFNTRTQVTRLPLTRGVPQFSTHHRTQTQPKKTTPASLLPPSSRCLSSILGKSNLQFAGMTISLTVSTSSLNLLAADCKQIIANHHMQSISFASGGDPCSEIVPYPPLYPHLLTPLDTPPSACHILECSEGLAQEVISTIGQAFELRFKQYLKNPPKLVTPHDRMAPFDGSAWEEEDDEGAPPPEVPYYNNFPGKQPPPGGLVDMRGRPGHSTGATLPYGQNDVHKQPLPPLPEPFDDALSGAAAAPPLAEQLQCEPWFHGSLSRRQAERLLTRDGDFLVRESGTTPGQYVLTGQQGSQPKHLLLVDPEGVVRTKDHRFESVSHLISYHMDNRLPIVSAGSEVCLQQPVERRA
ncbi:hypothetical protein JZ751_009937 [Albula glossodonta]|uniref:SHC-transforming protein 1 n=1 Tax=Albula glossodonta TaxID=121402 RepID=A0A8T2P103_9TELE|nr:hypothetical protein JZ751_009937 [Albula glossodonta]